MSGTADASAARVQQGVARESRPAPARERPDTLPFSNPSKPRPAHEMFSRRCRLGSPSIKPCWNDYRSAATFSSVAISTSLSIIFTDACGSRRLVPSHVS